MIDSLGGSMLIAIPIALLAGLVSFLSPCVLPLVPGYLGYVGGEVGADGKASRGRLLLGVSLFVLGFTVVFTIMNAISGAAGVWLVQYREPLTQLAGVIVILVGLVFIGQFAFLQRSIKPAWLPAAGIAGAPILGFIFGIGWVPCLSPTLAAITAISFGGGSPLQGAILGIAYSLGLGIPFVLVALGFSWVASSVSWVKRHIRIINLIGGALLVLIGVLMVSGAWSIMMSELGAIINEFVAPI